MLIKYFKSINMEKEKNMSDLINKCIVEGIYKPLLLLDMDYVWNYLDENFNIFSYLQRYKFVEFAINNNLNKTYPIGDLITQLHNTENIEKIMKLLDEKL